MGEFWRTMNVLVSREWKKVDDDIDEWVENIMKKDKTTEDKHLLQIGHVPSFCSSILTIEVREEEIREFWKKVDLPKIECTFTCPPNQTRIQHLMGSNYVSLVDRDYMQKLQDRILEDYSEKMNNRIKSREEEELDRVKTLVLEGKIPINKAPTEMASHPIMFIEEFRKLDDRTQKKFKPMNLLSTNRSEPLRSPSSKLAEEQMKYVSMDLSRNSTISHEDFIFEITPPAEFEMCRDECPLIKRLRDCEGVEEMYNLAEELIGIMHDYETSRSPDTSISQ